MTATNNPPQRFAPLQRVAKAFTPQSQPDVEESIPLRVLVQLLVFIGVAATDVAASTNNSIWAIPLSAVGSVWAYQARHRRNIVVKFFIAIAMIATLVVFLQSLIYQTEETRLLLARLLIQLQVLHSFDLPRRKDLGYSTVIGLILLGVAGTISQTTLFGLWLLAFLAISLPVLILDYRSRLGLSARSFKQIQLGVSPLALGSLLAIALVLGLGIFAVLPRLPGFQLRNFPVSVNINLQRQIPPGGIINPGKNGQRRNNSGGNGTGGGAQTGGDGNGVLETFPPLFSTEIDSTRSYRIKPELVMRVRSQAELFWRVIAYDEFTGKGWRISRSAGNLIRTLRRQPFNFEFYVPPSIGSLVPSNATKDVVQTYTIASEHFPTLIPAAAIPYRIFFPSEEIDLDSEGTMRAPGPLPLDMTYTVISSVPYRDRTALGKTSQRYPRSVRNYYLQLPANFAPTIQAQAIAIVNDARSPVTGKPLNLDNSYEKALYLAQYLKTHYKIQEFRYNGQGDIVAQFLDQKGGEPTHFVTSLVVLLRSLGIPARYAVGFNPGRFNPFTGFYEVYNTDIRSVVEVFFPGHGWFAFDPVPGNDLVPPSIEVDQTFSVLRAFWNWIAGFLPSPVVGFFATLFAEIGKLLTSGLSQLINWLNSMGWAGFAVGLMLFSGAGIAGWGLWNLLGWWFDRLRLAGLHPVQRSYLDMVRLLAERGMPKAKHQTPQEYAAQVVTQITVQHGDAVRALTQAYQDWRYGDRRVPTAQLQAWLKQLRRRSKLSR